MRTVGRLVEGLADGVGEREFDFVDALDGGDLRYAIALRIFRLRKLVRLTVKLSAILNWSLATHARGVPVKAVSWYQFTFLPHACKNDDSQENGG